MPSADVEPPPLAQAIRPTRSSLLTAVKRRPALAIWALFVFAIPFYVAPSGLPQPGDALVFVLVPAALLERGRRLDVSMRASVRALWWFTLWVAVANYGWALVLWKFDRLKDFLIHPFFYAFNAALFYAGLLIARRDRESFLRVTVYTVYLSIFVQFLASLLSATAITRGQVFRDQGFFNSPNQLGYFALLAACLFALTQRPLRIRRWIAGIGVAACAYLALISASRSALVGVAFVICILLFSNPRTIVLATLAALVLVSVGGPLSTAIDNAQERSELQVHKGTFAEQRGYDRIWKNPEYLITGAGEGDYQRFAETGETARELHSSFGSVLFAYGVVGAALFIIFLVRVFRATSIRDKAILIAGLSFALAHQGLRFTMFWVVLVVFVVLKQRGSRRAP